MPNRYGTSWGVPLNTGEIGRQLQQVEVTEDNTEVARGLKAAFNDLLARKQRGENVADQIMSFKIHAASQGYKNTREGRLEEAQKEAILNRRKQERFQQGRQAGQSVQEFYKEINDMQEEREAIDNQERRKLGL